MDMHRLNYLRFFQLERSFSRSDQSRKKNGSAAKRLNNDERCISLRQKGPVMSADSLVIVHSRHLSNRVWVHLAEVSL